MAQTRISVWLGIILILFGLIYVIFRRKEVDLGDERDVKGRYERAIEEFDPLDYHTKRAFAYEAEGSYEMAMKEYKKILEINPEDSVTHSHLGDIYYKMGKLDQAISEIKEVLRIDPDNWVQREALANLYCDKGRYDLAIREYEEALEINPNNALGNSLLGKAYYKMGYYIAAIRAYEESIGIDPAFGEPHLGLGLCYLARGDINGALREKKILEDLNRGLASQLSQEIKKTQATE